jgi:hypothetical protein
MSSIQQTDYFVKKEFALSAREEELRMLLTKPVLAFLIIGVLTSLSCSTVPRTARTNVDRAEQSANSTDASYTQIQWRAVQKKLLDLGYSPGPIDGVPGTRTRSAIRQFQQSRGLEATGMVSSAVGMALIEASKEGSSRQSAKPSSKRDTQAKTSGTNAGSKAQKVTAALQDDSPLNSDNLAGTWAPTQLWETKSFPIRELKRNALKVIYDFEKVGANRYQAKKRWRSGSGEPDSIELVIKKRRDGFSLQLPSNSAAMQRRFPAYSMDPKQSAHGVDILTSVTSPTTRDSMYMIRFRKTRAAEEARIDSYDYFSFCSGPARRFAQAARTELNALQSLASVDSRAAAPYRKEIALSLGMFGSSGFKDLNGIAFNGLSTAAQSTLIERLRICAIYNTDRAMADMVANGLFGDRFTQEVIKSDVGRSLHSKKPLNSSVRPDGMAQSLRQADAARKALTVARQKLDSSSLQGDKLLEAKWAMLREYAYKLPPSEIAPELSDLAVRMNSLEKRRATEREAELDRTAPAASQNTLILEATREYILENCSKAVLALRANNGQALLSLASARSVKARNGNCVIDSATHLFSFNLRSVEQQRCSANDDRTTCNFKARWACSYKLNPKFGFSKQTANIDPLCPLVRNSSVAMEGQYDKKAPRRWIAKQVDW